MITEFLIWMSRGSEPGTIKINASMFDGDRAMRAGAEKIRARKGYPKRLRVDTLWAKERLLTEIRDVPEAWFLERAIRTGTSEKESDKIEMICAHILRAVLNQFREMGYAVPGGADGRPS